MLQHVDDADAAVREFARVLRPGGRVALLDSDWATAITHPADPDVLERYRAFSLTQWPNPFSGRLLRGQLQAAGLAVDPDIGSSALVLPDDALRDGGVIAAGGPAAVLAGAITEAERDELAQRAGDRCGTWRGLRVGDDVRRRRAASGLSRRRPTGGRSGALEAGLEEVELVGSWVGRVSPKVVNHSGMWDISVRPFVGVDGERGLDVGAGQVEAGGVDRLGGGHEPDRGVDGCGGVVEAFDDPFQDTGVFAVAGP